MIVLWFAVILGVIFLVKWSVNYTRGDHQHGATRDCALEILNERYARGEIKKDEFDSKRQDLLL